MCVYDLTHYMRVRIYTSCDMKPNAYTRHRFTRSTKLWNVLMSNKTTYIFYSKFAQYHPIPNLFHVLTGGRHCCCFFFFFVIVIMSPPPSSSPLAGGRPPLSALPPRLVRSVTAARLYSRCLRNSVTVLTLSLPEQHLLPPPAHLIPNLGVDGRLCLVRAKVQKKLLFCNIWMSKNAFYNLRKHIIIGNFNCATDLTLDRTGECERAENVIRLIIIMI